jgi:hypothetical protein
MKRFFAPMSIAKLNQKDGSTVIVHATGSLEESGLGIKGSVPFIEIRSQENPDFIYFAEKEKSVR